MLNYIWLGLLVAGVLIGGFSGRMREIVEGTVRSAEMAVTLAIGLIGIMSLWLGVMRLAEKSGLIQSIARLLRPVLTRLFPDVPAQHPAMGAMLMNIAANMLGLVNAATPLGLRAMKDLESLNRNPGTATNAMCTFLAINTSSVQLIPMTAVAILASAGAANPTAIIGTAFLATACSTTAALVAVKSLEKLAAFQLPVDDRQLLEATQAEPKLEIAGVQESETPPASLALVPGGNVVLWLFAGCFLWFFLTLAFPVWFGRAPLAGIGVETGLVRTVNAISLLAIPFLLCFFPLYAALRRVAIYEEFVEGAKEGFHVAIRIVPFLVAILVAIGVFRSGGGIDLLTQGLRPILDLVRFPPELLPLSIMRPLSGSASLGLFTELVQQHGPDSLIARIAGSLYGSTETTFYVVAVYFGSVSVKRTRHAVPAGLIADAVGVIAAVTICTWVFG
jgi:spore maturation protein SpmA